MKSIALHVVALVAAMLLPVAGWADSSCDPTGDGRCVLFEEATGSIQTTQLSANTTLTLKGFNPALGTLDEVDCFCGQVTNSGTATMTVTFFNPSPFPNPGAIGRAFIFGNIRTPSGSSLASVIDEFDCFVGSLDAGASMTNDCADHGLELSGNPVFSNDLAGFVNTGNVFLPASLGVDLVPFSDSIETLDSVSVSFGVGVVYIYTPTQVPEPAGGILLFTALVVVRSFLWVRKRASSRSLRV